MHGRFFRFCTEFAKLAAKNGNLHMYLESGLSIWNAVNK